MPPRLGRRPCIDEQLLQAVVVGLRAGQQGVVRPDRTVFVAIRLIAPHLARIGTSAGTLIYLLLLDAAARFLGRSRRSTDRHIVGRSLSGRKKDE